LPPYHLLVLRQEAVPAPVAQLGRATGGVHQVGEQHRGQHPVGVGGRQGASQELLGQGYDLVLIAEVRRVILAR
jgi:hypothetical protein